MPLAGIRSYSSNILNKRRRDADSAFLHVDSNTDWFYVHRKELLIATLLYLVGLVLLVVVVANTRAYNTQTPSPVAHLGYSISLAGDDGKVMAIGAWGNVCHLVGSCKSSTWL